MAFLEWNDRLDVHVESMNREHRELIRAMNAVYDANGTTATAVGTALDRLVALTVRHFEDEEAYMASIGYEGLSTHRFIHKDLLDKVGEHAARFRASGSATLPKDFFEFLRLWLVAHIQGIDAKYGKVPA